MRGLVAVLLAGAIAVPGGYALDDGTRPPIVGELTAIRFLL